MKARINPSKDCVPYKLHSLPAENKKISPIFKTSLFIVLSFVVNIAIAQTPKLSKFYTSLYALNSGNVKSLTDGVANTYYTTYCNNVDAADAKKLISFNTRETISIMRDGEKLAIEKRVPIVDRDSIFLDMEELMDKTYELSFLPKNFDPSLQAYLVDEFKSTISPIGLSTDDTTKYSFDANSAEPASKAANRFYVVFTLPGLLPVNFSSIKALESNRSVSVEWDVENEVNVDHYNIERSIDGIHFTTASVKAVSVSQAIAKQYTWTDVNAVNGTNFYRISNVNKNGTITYSKIVKVEVGNKTTVSINAYPTVMNEGVLSIQFNNTPKGNYVLRLINTNGQIMYIKTINHAGGNATEMIRLDKTINKGMCQLNIIGPDNKSFPSVKLLNR